MHPSHIHWFMKEEEKRKEREREHEIERLNRQFSHLIQKLAHKVDRSKYQKEELLFNRQLVSSSIWRLCYQNNFVNPKVLTLQAGWLLCILEKEQGLGTIDRYKEVEQETLQLIRRARNVDVQAFSAILREHPSVHTIL